MANSVWQATIQNAAGDIVPGAEITVIDEGTGLNAVIFSSKAGAALTNPFNADAGGFAQFYSGPGEYRITAFDIGTGLTQTFDNWRLGDAGARDVGTDPENVPLNSNLGDSSTRNVGLNTGDVLSPEGAGLDGGETNWTSGNFDIYSSEGFGRERLLSNESGASIAPLAVVAGSGLLLTYFASNGTLTVASAPVGTWQNTSGRTILNFEKSYLTRIG